MHPIEIEFLGSGDAFGSGGRLQTCILVTADDGRFLIDCGATSLVAMKRALISPASIDAIVLTHLHGDHFGGIPFLILDAQFSGRTRPLRILGPSGTRARVEAAMEVLFPGSSRVARRFEVEFTELTPGNVTTVGPARVTPFLGDHPSGAPSLILRVGVGERVLAFSGDTAWTEALVEAARDADLLVAEAYRFERKVRFHLDHDTLVAHRQRLRCRRIVLTHMSDDMLEHVGLARMECARDGLKIVI